MPGKRIEWAATGKGTLDGFSCGVKDVFDIEELEVYVDAFRIVQFFQKSSRGSGRVVIELREVIMLLAFAAPSRQWSECGQRFVQG